MIFKSLFIILSLLYGVSFADSYDKFESINKINLESNIFMIESGTLNYDQTLDSRTNCLDWGWWCDIKFGLKNAESQGVNGIIISGYAYHPIAGWHIPVGYDKDAKLNELTPGLGYTRTFFNPQYNSEYTLYALGFVDSFYKPELHVGYMYQKYFDINDAGNLKWGVGYTPFVFVKSSMVGDAPIPLPGAALVTSVKYDKVDFMLIYFNVLFFSARIDL